MGDALARQISRSRGWAGEIYTHPPGIWGFRHVIKGKIRQTRKCTPPQDTIYATSVIWMERGGKGDSYAKNPKGNGLGVIKKRHF